MAKVFPEKRDLDSFRRQGRVGTTNLKTPESKCGHLLQRNLANGLREYSFHTPGGLPLSLASSRPNIDAIF